MYCSKDTETEKKGDRAREELYSDEYIQHVITFCSLSMVPLMRDIWVNIKKSGPRPSREQWESVNTWDRRQRGKLQTVIEGEKKVSRITDVIQITQQWSELQRGDRAGEKGDTQREEVQSWNDQQSTAMLLEPVREKMQEIKSLKQPKSEYIHRSSSLVLKTVQTENKNTAHTEK